METKNKKKHNQKEEVVRMKNGKFIKKSEYDKIVKESSKKKTSKKKINTMKIKKLKEEQIKQQEIELIEKEIKKAFSDYEQAVENENINKSEKDTSTEIEDTFKVEEEKSKKIETKKNNHLESIKKTLNKPVLNTKKKQKTEEEKKKKRKVIILLLLLLFLFFILDVDDLILGVPTEPKIKIPKDRVYNSTVIQIEEDGYTRKKLAYYLYCIRQDGNIKECEWKKTYTKNVVVSQNGENYVWFKGVTEDGLIGKPSKPVIVVIDSEVSTEIKIEKEVTEDTIKVIVKATDEEEIKKYYYKIEDGQYLESDKNTYTFKDLKPDTEYKITIIVEDELGNEKEIEFKVKTKKEQEESEENQEDDKITEDNESKEETEDQMEENTELEKAEIQEIPEISLSKVPIKFKIGESYKLPSSYKFGKSGGTVKCTVNNKEYTNTKELGIGTQVIKCSATSNTGITVKVEKEVEVGTDTTEETIWDGWITMNLYFPEGTTNWMWRLGKEETRTGEENTGWKEYTGPITVRLTDVENIYIKYALNGEEVIIPPKGKLVVDINPESYEVEEGKTTTVTITYTKDAEKKQYRINEGEWQDYTESFRVLNNTRIDARVVKTENIYDEEGNLEESRKVTNYDSVYIRTYVESTGGGSTGSGGSSGGSSSGGGSSIGSEEGGYGSNYVTTPTYAIAGPIISIDPSDIAEEVTVRLSTKKTARAIYYKIGSSGSYKKYEEAFTINRNITVYAYYIEATNGQTSRTSSRYIDNIKQNNKPYVAINLSTTEKYQSSVEVSLKASDYDSLEYSLDGEIYTPYINSFTVTKNCTVYAKATNQNGTTYESRSITNIGNALSPKEELSVAIFTNPRSEEVTGLVNKTTVEIEYDSKAEKKYYKIGNGSYKEYTGPFEVTSNTTVTGYAISSNGSGKESKQIDFLTTGIAEPIIKLNTYKSAYNVEVTINYDKTSSVKNYRVGTGDLLEYTGPITVEENEPIYAYSSNELGYESESYYEITNIVEEPRYLLLDQGSYFILKLNYPSSSVESSREYKWTSSGSWKQYNSQGILLIKKEYEEEILSDSTAGVKVKDAIGKEVVFNEHYYVVSNIRNELMENLFMRWDYAISSVPKINLSTTEPTRQLYVSIEYNNASVVKEYKIQTSDGKTTEWLPYTGKIKIDKNNTIIYARETSSIEANGKIESRKITNIDEEKPTVEAKADFETPTRKLTIQIVGTDNLGVQVVGWAPGKKDVEYFQDVAALRENNSTFTVKENGIYTLYVEDKVGNTATKQIEVTNIDKNAPAIDINVLTEKYGIEAEVEIDYGDSTTKQYKIGPSGSYQNYTDKLVLKSLEVAQYANVDGTLSIYAKGIDSSGNEIEVSEKIYVLDLDIPKAPVINASSGYPILTEYGVKYDDVVTIVYDNRNDIINYISMDGKTWEEYTGLEHVTSGTVYAKSEKKVSKLTVSTSKKVTTPTDALGMNAFDENVNTNQNITSGQKKIYIDSSMWNKQILITAYFYSNKFGGQHNAIYIYKNDGTNSTYAKYTGSEGLASGVTYTNQKILIPENTAYIMFESGTNTGYYSQIKEVSIYNDPIYTIEKVYPTITSHGIENGYNYITLRYFSTSIQKLYKINDDEWQKYNGEKIKLSLGDIVNIKGIDKYGTETKLITYESVLASDAINDKTYDGKTSTYAKITSGNKKIYIDSSMWNKQILITAYFYSNKFGEQHNAIYIYKNDGTRSTYAKYTGSGGLASGVTYTNRKISIPENTTYIMFESGTNTGYYSQIKEISVLSSTVIPDEEHPEEPSEEEIAIPNFVSSPTISVSDSDKYTSTKTVSISYPSGYTNQYSYDAENWMTYTGNIIVDKETTIFARTISGDEVVSSSSYQITKIDNVAPSISLSEVPLQINVGEDYTLPSNYSFNANKTGGSIKCLLDDTTEITSTKDISAGEHHIKCTATTGSGLIETAEINITVIDNTTEEENTDTNTDNEEITNQEGEVGNEE